MTEFKPQWFLDIDGVINSYPAPKQHHIKRIGEGKYKFVEIAGFPIWYSTDVIDFINAVHNSGLVEVVWLTTWTSQAKTEFAPVVGLDPSFAVITDTTGGTHPWNPRLGESTWWKWQRVQEWIGGTGVKFVWTDDELRKEVKNAARAMFDKDQCLLLTPMSCPGLEPEHLDRILEFLQNA